MGHTNDQPETDLTLQVFRSYQLTREQIALSEFINRIRTGMYESVVAVVRRMAAHGDLERANAAKGTMPSVCVSALFDGRRTAGCVARYLPLLPLDFDGLPSLAEAERLRTRAMQLPFTLAAFVTSFMQNTLFAPVFMIIHKISDLHILRNGGTLRGYFTRPCVTDLIASLDWRGMWRFLFKRTIPLFWIPAHTVTYLLPAEFRILFAALLGVILGVFMSVNAKK